jgi:hypothetical protein
MQTWSKAEQFGYLPSLAHSFPPHIRTEADTSSAAVDGDYGMCEAACALTDL